MRGEMMQKGGCAAQKRGCRPQDRNRTEEYCELSELRVKEREGQCELRAVDAHSQDRGTGCAVAVAWS